ncbi:Holliday junction resolvase RuvX [Chlorobium sp.]|mgnify:FL=1|jgi:putative Holliday junction resolvase|uniref:Holliday junction resolvase RuvX n=1 Tax=Chlorobium sp. TaxID=1095 RepID=UPI003C36156C|nr:Holliday junction resolvase RuvX [Chlorobiaceae bacterium]NTW94343.1 Holliday junction resolvase RuvX [Chlorobiaceae bacterium]
MDTNRKKRIVAIDYGTKRIGLAESDPLQLFAQPVGTLDRNALFSRLEAMTSSDEIEKILVGYPLNDDGTENRMSGVIDRFIEELSIWFPGLPIERINEHGSSRDAMQILSASGLSRKERNRKGRLDSAAACVILREYLETRR